MGDLGRIPREEVEEIGRVVMRELDALEPGCVSTIVGGYVPLRSAYSRVWAEG